jgi:hypothetical protein
MSALLASSGVDLPSDLKPPDAAAIWTVMAGCGVANGSVGPRTFIQGFTGETSLLLQGLVCMGAWSHVYLTEDRVVPYSHCLICIRFLGDAILRGHTHTSALCEHQHHAQEQDHTARGTDHDLIAKREY